MRSSNSIIKKHTIGVTPHNGNIININAQFSHVFTLKDAFFHPEIPDKFIKHH